MAMTNETLTSNGTLQEILDVADVQIQDMAAPSQSITDALFGILARLLGFGVILGSLLFAVWGWLRLLS